MRIKDTKIISYRRSDIYGRGIPAIIIEGKFLEELGFKLGGKLNMRYYKHKIIITACKKG